MSQHLSDSTAVVQGLINLIFSEEEDIKNLQDQCILNQEKYDQRASLELEFHRNKDEVNIPEDQKEIVWYQIRKELSELLDEIRLLECSINSKQEIITILCGSILEIAKYGIMVNYSRLSECPDIRFIGKESIKNIIYQGCKQSRECKVGKYSKSVQSCFSSLENSFGSRFSLEEKPFKSLAYSIIELLGWKDYLVYERDMTALLYH